MKTMKRWKALLTNKEMEQTNTAADMKRIISEINSVSVDWLLKIKSSFNLELNTDAWIGILSMKRESMWMK